LNYDALLLALLHFCEKTGSCTTYIIARATLLVHEIEVGVMIELSF
jgi:hypothetical protein